VDHATSAGGAAEGSQGQARSEAERAAPGLDLSGILALKGRQKAEPLNGLSVANILAPLQGAHLANCRSRGGALRFATRLPLATFCRASGAGWVVHLIRASLSLS